MDYEGIDDLCEQIVDMYHENDDYITVVGFYDDIIAIMNELARYDELFLYDINIESPILSEYEDEYTLTIADGGYVYVQKAVDDDGVYYDLEGMVIAFDGVSDEILSQMDFDCESYDNEKSYYDVPLFSIFSEIINFKYGE